MAGRNRRGAQLSIELPPELLQRLKEHAKAQGATSAGLVRQWIEAGLDGALSPASTRSTAVEAASGLVDRVAALEAALAALQARPAPTPSWVLEAPSPSPRASAITRSQQPPLPLSGEQQITHLGDAPEGAITTAELATRTGTNRSGWNNWIAKTNAGVGDVRRHPEAGSWRLVGKAPAPSGGPDRWLWEPA